ncbi:uncharacterized protein LOC131926899 [Physella acuta]|uniref:uncharacterized protein LOC131926899 n=1 Tax=Physella acuta TaxID=109671 RepID=UPI0027DC35D3|nr:uncharacterized protein LOC131926899 [Physella acuta]
MGTAASMLDKVERIHQFEDLEERIQELKLAKSSEEKIFPLVRYNTEHFYFYKLAVQSLLLLHTNNYKRCSEVLANLHCWSLKKVPESDEVASLFEEFLSEISFCNVGFKKYKSLLQTFKIKSFGEAKKIELPEDNKKIVPAEVLEVVLNLRRIWLLFSRPGKKFAKQLASFGVVYELAMEIRKMQANDENLTREDHAATETAFGIILNIAKMKEKPIAMKDSKLLNALDKIVGNQSGYILNVMALVIIVLSTDGAMKRRIPPCEHQIDPLLLLTMSALKNNNYTENPTAADLIKTLAALCSMTSLWSKLSKSKQTLHKICQEVFTKANEQLKDQHPDVHEALTVHTLMVIREMLKNLGEKEIANYTSKINACASDSNEKIKKVAKDVLWQLNKKNTNSFEGDENVPRFNSLRKRHQRRNLHVMISYCHAEADFAKKLNKKLNEYGIKTWIDEKDIRKQGYSTLDAMAEAVENSAVVLVCCSRNYLQSRSCQMEAEYAHTQHIPLKFLMVQEGYMTPTGWLGILLRAHMYYNFTLPPNFDETFATLVEKIKKECKDNPMSSGATK